MSFVCIRQATTRNALNSWERIVARAAPTSPKTAEHDQQDTSAILTRQLAARKYSRPLRISHCPQNRRPYVIDRWQCTGKIDAQIDHESPSTSSGVPMASSINGASPIPANMITTPEMILNISAVWTA